MTTLAVKPAINKLYRRCAWQHHDQCPGSFGSYSVCNCPCHADVGCDRADLASVALAIETAASDAQTLEAYRARIEKESAVSEAESIIVVARPAKPAKLAGPRNAKGGLKCSVGGYGWPKVSSSAKMARYNALGDAYCQAHNVKGFVGFPSTFDPSGKASAGRLTRYANQNVADSAAGAN